MAVTHPQPGVSILVSGSEILDGRVLDTNSNWIAGELTRFGIPLREVVILGDESEPLREAILRLSKRSSHLVLSGGLGPTDDDLTREVVATVLGRPLEEYAEARAHIVGYFEQRQRTPDPSNFKQALLPAGSTIIPNPVGTAPGFRCVLPSGCELFTLPGVPRELKTMFEQTVFPVIRGDFPTARAVHRREFRLFGKAEADVGSLVKGCGLPPSIDVSYRASFPEIHVVLKSTDDTVLDAAVQQVEAAIAPEFIVNRTLSRSFETELLGLLEERGTTLAVYEGMTGGLLGGRMTDVPGASRSFVASISAYSATAAVPGFTLPEELGENGMVSAVAARESAAQVRAVFGSTIGVSIMGYAGPDGRAPDTPAGTFFIGFSSPSTTLVLRYFFLADRRMVRSFAVHTCMDVVRRYLTNLPVPSRNLVAVEDR